MFRAINELNRDAGTLGLVQDKAPAIGQTTNCADYGAVFYLALTRTRVYHSRSSRAIPLPVRCAAPTIFLEIMMVHITREALFFSPCVASSTAWRTFVAFCLKLCASRRTLRARRLLTVESREAFARPMCRQWSQGQGQRRSTREPDALVWSGTSTVVKRNHSLSR